MTHVATLISASGGLNISVVNRASQILQVSGAVQWLGPDAVDIPFTPAGEPDKAGLADRLRGLASDIDVVVQLAANRRKKLFLADMDSTMIMQECIDELADYAGLKTKVGTITERAMRGEIEFEPALRERVALLEGLPITIIDQVLQDRIKLSPGAKTLVATMRANGTYTCMVSGGFTAFTDRIAAAIGFEESRANTLTIVDGHKLAGSVVEPIFGRNGKRTALIELRDKLRLGKDDTLAIGDGANDIDMVLEAGLGVAYHAKKRLAALAPARIDHCHLTALLYMQGYQRAEFVEA
ncbi:MAG TPA: phosphoserine phosphatase SerB [Pseudolabrys sp.]|nr:phosphoserine phosphatase SerB [Pseudolabrys sp.]